MDLSEHATRNREIWNKDAPNWIESGRKSWASPTPWWGAWEVPEADAGILSDVSGLDVLDLGCGTGYWCAWLARPRQRAEGDPDEVRYFMKRGSAQRWPCEEVWVARRS